jgi:hypothetical protein
MLAPAALAARLLPAQQRDPGIGPPDDAPSDPRLPSGKSQKDAIATADYEKNIKDARELIDVARSFELDLEKEDRFVLSVATLKKLDDIEKITRRIRDRLKRS